MLTVILLLQRFTSGRSETNLKFEIYGPVGLVVNQSTLLLSDSRRITFNHQFFFRFMSKEKFQFLHQQPPLWHKSTMTTTCNTFPVFWESRLCAGSNLQRGSQGLITHGAFLTKLPVRRSCLACYSLPQKERMGPGHKLGRIHEYDTSGSASR